MFFAMWIQVLLVDRPDSTASVALYKERLLKKGFHCNYCSTIECALTLLGLNEDIDEMEEVLKTLKN